LTIREKDSPVFKNSVFSSDIVKYPQDPGAKSQVYDRENVTHGVNCNCCTKIEESNRLEERRREWFKEAHKGRNERARRAKSIRQLETNTTEETQRDDWSPYPTIEDFDSK
jgi:hypothetical protein